MTSTLPSYFSNTYSDISFVASSTNFEMAISDKLKYNKQLYNFRMGNIYSMIESKDRFQWMGYIFIPHKYINQVCGSKTGTGSDILTELNKVFSVYLRKYNVQFNFYESRSIVDAIGFYPGGYNLLSESCIGNTEATKEYYSFEKIKIIIADISNDIINKFPSVKKMKYSEKFIKSPEVLNPICPKLLGEFIASLCDVEENKISEENKIPEENKISEVDMITKNMKEFFRCMKETALNSKNPSDKDICLAFLEECKKLIYQVEIKKANDQIPIADIITNNVKGFFKCMEETILNSKNPSDKFICSEFLEECKKLISKIELLKSTQ